MTFNVSTTARPDGENWRPKTEFIARTEGTKWVVRGRGFAWSPPDILVGVTTDVAVTSADDLVYVALVVGDFSPYQLIAVNRVSQRTVWSSEVWTRPRVSCSHGFCLQSVILVPAKESVVVFGSTCGAVYLAAYRAVDGTNFTALIARTSNFFLIRGRQGPRIGKPKRQGRGRRGHTGGRRGHTLRTNLRKAERSIGLPNNEPDAGAVTRRDPHP